MRDERFSLVWFGCVPNDWNLAGWQTDQPHSSMWTSPGRRAREHTNILKHVHALKHTSIQTKGEEGGIHDYWQLSPSIKVFFIRTEGVFIREMKQGHIWVKASVTAFISPLQQRKEEGEEKTEKEDQRGYFSCLITATHSGTREIPLESIYRACSMINGCISGRMYAGSIAWP